MAGHNKWSKVKHMKARVDAKKEKLFSRFSQEISIAVRDGRGVPDLNPRLCPAIDSAKTQSMPKENIEPAIKKGTGKLGGEAIQEVTDEGYTAPTELNAVASVTQEAGWYLASQQLVSVAQNPSEIEDHRAAKQALLLGDYEDPMNVYTDFEVSEEVLSQLDG